MIGHFQHFPPGEVCDTLQCRNFFRVALGFGFLCWCYNQPQQHRTCRKWIRRFDRTCLKDVRTFTQLQRLFHTSHVVYILLHAFGTVGLNVHMSNTEHYIGSTTHTLQDRQNTRIRKLRQLQRSQPVSCELALHWFCSQNNFHQFLVLPLLCTETTLQTRTLESFLIQQWCPPLNYPFILSAESQNSTLHHTYNKHYATHFSALAIAFMLNFADGLCTSKFSISHHSLDPNSTFLQSKANDPLTHNATFALTPCIQITSLLSTNLRTSWRIHHGLGSEAS